MNNPLNNSISKMAAEYSESSESQKDYTAGANAALDMIRGYLSISRHLSDSVRISDLRNYISRLKS